jgi:transposase InsO family protein
VAICADTVFLDPEEVLSVRQGEILTLRFGTTMSPTEVSLQRFDRPNGEPAQTVVLPPSNPSRFAADLPPGVWILVPFTRWAQGDATYFFKVEVTTAPGGHGPTPPARPVPATPHFTG